VRPNLEILANLFAKKKGKKKKVLANQKPSLRHAKRRGKGCSGLVRRIWGREKKPQTKKKKTTKNTSPPPPPPPPPPPTKKKIKKKHHTGRRRKERDDNCRGGNPNNSCSHSGKKKGGSTMIGFFSGGGEKNGCLAAFPLSELAKKEGKHSCPKRRGGGETI